MLTNKLGLLMILSVLFVMGLFVPTIPVYVIPELKITVTDKDDRPVSGKLVIQRWTHSTFESDYHTGEEISDENGIVVFPSRWIWESSGGYIIWSVIDMVPVLHASSGPHAFFLVEGTYSTSESYKLGTRLPKKIVLE